MNKREFAGRKSKVEESYEETEAVHQNKYKHKFFFFKKKKLLSKHGYTLKNHIDPTHPQTSTA